MPQRIRFLGQIPRRVIAVAGGVVQGVRDRAHQPAAGVGIGRDFPKRIPRGQQVAFGVVGVIFYVAADGAGCEAH